MSPHTPDDVYRGVKVGDRVRITGRMDDPSPLKVGAEGTVRALMGTRLFPQIDVDWDDDRTLFLLPADPFEVVS